MNKRILIFTDNYPYGKSEPFLETELKYIDHSFEKVSLFPLEKGRDKNKLGAHAKGRNNYIGIALTGYDYFTPQQIKSLKILLSELKIKEVYRHHALCPGKGLNVEQIQKELLK